MNTSTAELIGTLEDFGYDIHELSDGLTGRGRRVGAIDLAAMGPGDWTNLVAEPSCPVGPPSFLRQGDELTRRA
jgi:hypothetical protein